jgi:hypothetical protein
VRWEGEGMRRRRRCRWWGGAHPGLGWRIQNLLGDGPGPAGASLSALVDVDLILCCFRHVLVMSRGTK